MSEIYEALHTAIESSSSILEEEWEDIKSYWKTLKAKRNEHLTQIGKVEHYFYFVHDGVLRGYSFNDGNEVTVGFSYNGDYSGAYDSFLEQTPSDFAIQAISDADLLRIHYTDLMKLYDKYKCMERWGKIFNSNILIGMARRQVEARSYSAEEKFERLAKDSPHIFQLVSQKHLASYLGMTPETFSRLRKQRLKKGY